MLFAVEISHSTKIDTIYHHFVKTDGPPEISLWNVGHKDNLMEIIDADGRVTELRMFGTDGNLIQSDCYLTSRTLFEYSPGTITVKNYTNTNQLNSGIECGRLAKYVYYLSSNNIDSCRGYLNYTPYFSDTSNLDAKFLSKLRSDFKKHGTATPKQIDCSEIEEYQYSKAKFHGVTPTKK